MNTWKIKQEDVEEAYDYFAYYLLPIFFKHFTPVWIKPKDIGEISLTANKSRYSEIGDLNPYIKDLYDNNYDIAKDILKNGTYWPLCILCVSKSIILREGLHRVSYLQNNEQGKELPMLALMFNKYSPMFSNTKKFTNESNISEIIILPKKFFNIQLDTLKVEGKLIDIGDSYVYQISKQGELYNLYPLLPMIIAHTIHNNEISTKKVINSMKEFNKVYKLPILKLTKYQIEDEEGNKFNPDYFDLEKYLSLKGFKKKQFNDLGK